MDKFLIIKLVKKRSKSKDNRIKNIVVTFNRAKVNGGYRFDKIGIVKYIDNYKICYLNFYKLGYRLNRGVQLKTKVSWLIGIIGKYESEYKLK